MNAKEFLEHIQQMDSAINTKIKLAEGFIKDAQRADKRQRYFEQGINISASLKPDPIKGDPCFSRVEDAAVNLADATPSERAQELWDRVTAINNAIAADTDRLIDTKRAAVQLIDELPTARYREILLNHFVNGLDLEKVSKLMHYNEKYVYEILASALDEFEEMYQKKKPPG